MNKIVGLFSKANKKVSEFVQEASLALYQTRIITEDAINEKRKGAFAFEYIIVLVVMVGVIFTGWSVLGNAVLDKIDDIAAKVGGSNLGGVGRQ